LSGAPKSGLNLVRNEQNPVLVADFTHGLHPLDGCRNKTSFTLNRFDYDGGDIFCRRRFLKDGLETPDIVLYGFFVRHPGRFAIQIGKFCAVDAVRERTEAVGIRFLGSHRHCQGSASVKRAGKHDDIRTPCSGLCNLHGVFIRFGAAVCEHCLPRFSAGRNNFVQLFGKRHISFMRDNMLHAVEKSSRLFLHGPDDFRLAVADIEHSDSPDPVQKPVPIDIFKHGAFSALDHAGVAALNCAKYRLCTALDKNFGLRPRHRSRDNFR